MPFLIFFSSPFPFQLSAPQHLPSPIYPFSYFCVDVQQSLCQEQVRDGERPPLL